MYLHIPNVSIKTEDSLHLLEYFKGKTNYYCDDKTVLRCIKLIFDFSAGIKDQLDKIFETAIQMDEKDDHSGNWKIITFLCFIGRFVYVPKTKKPANIVFAGF